MRDTIDTTPLLECRHVSKQFSGTIAVKEATASFERDAIHGLLGANGAGKTTLLHLLSGQIFQTQGDILYEGSSVHENPHAVANICFVKSEERSWMDFKVKHLMNFCSLLYPHWDEEFANELLQTFRLPLGRRYKNLSRGMQSLVGIVRGLASRCQVTLFDEPTLGLDADMRETFYDLLIRDFSENPRTIILSTHLIDESAKLFQYITLIEQGTITTHLETEQFMEQAHYLQGNSSLLECLSEDPHVLHQESLAGTTRLVWWGDLDNREQLIHQGIEIQPVPLQKLFVYLTRKRLRSSQSEDVI